MRFATFRPVIRARRGQRREASERCQNGVAPLLALAAVALVGCSETTDPAMAAIAGTYVATTLAGLENGETVDALAAGASITLVLRADATTGGTFFVPAEVTGGSTDFEASLDGLWSASGRTVLLEHDAATFMKAVDWTYDEEARTLAAHTTTVDAILTRQ